MSRTKHARAPRRRTWNLPEMWEQWDARKLLDDEIRARDRVDRLDFLDGTLEAIDVPDGDHTSREAVILAVVDAKTRHHRRPRRRRAGSRKFSAWRFLKLLSSSYAPVGKPGPMTVQAPRPTS